MLENKAYVSNCIFFVYSTFRAYLSKVPIILEPTVCLRMYVCFNYYNSKICTFKIISNIDTQMEAKGLYFYFSF